MGSSAHFWAHHWEPSLLLVTRGLGRFQAILAPIRRRREETQVDLPASPALGTRRDGAEPRAANASSPIAIPSGSGRYSQAPTSLPSPPATLETLSSSIGRGDPRWSAPEANGSAR